MDPPSPGELSPGQSRLVNVEARGRKRKRPGTPVTPVTPITVLPDVDPSAVYMKKRMSVLSKLHRRRHPVDSLKSLWKVVLDALKELEPRDVTFSLLYSVTDKRPNGDEPETLRGDQIKPAGLALEGAIGLHENSVKAALLYDLITIELRKEPQMTEPQILEVDNSGPAGYALHNMPYNPTKPAENALLCPILAHSTTLTAFLILSMPDEPDFLTFAHVLTSTISTSVSNILLLQNLSSVQTASEELLRRVSEAERSTFMFRHMAESATVGCAIFSPSGVPMWLNEAYLNLTGVKREDFRPGMWQKAIVDEDVAMVEEKWGQLASGESIVPFAFRVKRRKKSGDGERAREGEEGAGLQEGIGEREGGMEALGYRWLLSNAFVDRDENGECRRVMGWLTDISAQKWSEWLQAKRLEDALETKRQTERFIDMVSHEIRNPLSAIIQTADGMLLSMDLMNDGDHSHSNGLHNTLDNIVDAGKTIILCANHQKRIVDDILTLSKLDSNLLVISPNQARPHDVVQNAIKMFEAELSSAQIEASISTDESYQKLSIDTVLLDESRVMQILLNLITNAIKFTRNRPERYVRVRLAASQSPPSIDTSEISYIAPRSRHLKVSASVEARQKEEIYLIFSIEDTGPGLGKDDMKSLFQRFSQASPKTYSYGGFGLGLFICRELAELQGGQIGLSSVLGQGTTFTFYIQARLCTPDAPKLSSNSNVKPLELQSNSSHKDPNRSTSTTPSPRTELNDSLNNALEPKNIHILVVEDNKINQTVLVRHLRLLGYKVHTADHGLQALDFLSRTTFFNPPSPSHQPNPPPLHKSSESTIAQDTEDMENKAPIPLSVMLLDLEMPIMDGLTCVKRIREMQKEGIVKGHVPVIAVTANARNEQIAEARGAGMDAVLTKPFRVPELLPKIAAVMGKGKGKVRAKEMLDDEVPI